MKFSKKNRVAVFDWLGFTNKFNKQFHCGFVDTLSYAKGEIKTLQPRKLVIDRLSEMASYFNCDPVEIGLVMRDNNWTFSIITPKEVYRWCSILEIKSSCLLEEKEKEILLLDSPKLSYDYIDYA